jgi:hypothetical protein
MKYYPDPNFMSEKNETKKKESFKPNKNLSQKKTEIIDNKHKVSKMPKKKLKKKFNILPKENFPKLKKKSNLPKNEKTNKVSLKYSGKKRRNFIKKKKEKKLFLTRFNDYHMKGLFSRLSSFFPFLISLRNIIINHFMIFFSIYDHSLLFFFNQTLSDIIITGLKAYDFFWGGLMSILGLNDSLFDSQKVFGKYYQMIKIFGYFICTHLHITISIFIVRNIPIVNYLFDFSDLTSERWSYQFTNRLLFHLINSTLREKLFSNILETYDNTIRRIGLYIINTGNYFNDLTTVNFWKDADPKNDTRPSEQTQKERKKKKRRYYHLFENVKNYFKLLNEKEENVRPKKKIRLKEDLDDTNDKSIVLDQLALAIENIQFLTPPYNKELLFPIYMGNRLPSVSNKYKGIHYIQNAFRKVLEKLGDKVLEKFDKIIKEYSENPLLNNRLAGLLLSGLQSLARLANLDLKDYKLLNKLHRTIGYSLHKEGMQFSERGKTIDIDILPINENNLNIEIEIPEEEL